MAVNRVHPYKKPSAEFLARIEPIATRLVTPIVDGKGRETLPMISPDSEEWKSLKVREHSQFGGLRPNTTPSAAVISWARPEVIVAPHGSPAAAISVGQRIEGGEALLYGLQTSAIRYGDAKVAEAIVASAPNMKVLFSFLDWMIEMIPTEHMDSLMLEQTESWVPSSDLMTWCLLEHHKHWSETLSRRLIAAVNEQGSVSKNRWWQFGGNGFAGNLHPALLEEAVAALKPFTKTENNARRWSRRLKERMKNPSLVE